MALFLTESEVLELLPMERAIERIESSFIAQHKGEAINRARERIFLPHSSFHYMAAGLPQENLLGMKVYTITRAAWRFVVLLFDAASGALLAVLEADHLGRIRTGAPGCDPGRTSTPSAPTWRTGASWMTPRSRAPASSPSTAASRPDESPAT